MNELIKLIVLFFVIFDPLLSGMVFISATKAMPYNSRVRIGLYAILVAMLISAIFLFFGHSFLSLFSTNINDVKIAGGILLAILGLKMSLGYELMTSPEKKDPDSKVTQSQIGIASLIGTPLLTGPAAITTIIISGTDYGILTTGLAVFIVLLFAAIIFMVLSKFPDKISPVPLQVTSTILGLITLAWGIDFIRTGLGF
jgi:multiple antibiotic resistance protein